MAHTRTREQILSGIETLAPFHHAVELPYGLRTDMFATRKIQRTRVTNLVRLTWPPLLRACGGSLAGKRVLDVACCSGGFSIAAAEVGAEYVLGIDIVDRYLQQADFVRDSLDLPADKVEFRKLSAEQVSPETVGEFDVTFCFGILYHFQDPVLAMKRLASVTHSIMLVDTDVVPTLSRKPFWHMNVMKSEPEGSKHATGLWRTDRVVQFAPNKWAVIGLLRFLGFKHVTELRPIKFGMELRYYARRRMAFLAMR
jgi:2-polyprenyl-3-methyl-5-hydroxy-6-metoxy-1,4-benzoquinol methylase